MSGYTDKDIPICCSECSPDVYCEGLEEMISHILELHDNYSLSEAREYAEKWMESAYERVEKEQTAYYEDRAYERGLNRLRGKP